MIDLSVPERLLLELAAGCAHDGALEGLGESEALRLTETASAFRLAPLVAQRLDAGRTAWPEQARRALGDETRMLAHRWLLQQRTLRDVSEKFAANAIDFVALKGVALALKYYRDPLLRPMRDLDLLVREADAATAFNLLTAAGFRELPEVISRPVEQSHQYPALRSPEGVLVEIHFTLMSDWPQGASLAKKVLESERAVQCLGASVRVPERQDLVLHLIAHATLNRPFDVGPQVIADLAAIGFGTQEPSAAIAERADALGLRRALQLVCAMLWELRASDAQNHPFKEQVAAAFSLMLASEEDERQRKFLLRLGGAKPDARKVLTKLMRPTPAALAELSGHDAHAARRWLAYPNWLADRFKRYRRSTRSAELLAQVERASTLSQWLRARE